MHRLRLAVVPLRVALVALFCLLVVFQVLSLPGQFAHMAAEDPDLGGMRGPALALAVLEIACLQVIIACTWKLLGLVEEDRIFSPGALRWVDVIVGAIAVGVGLVSAAILFLIATWDDPGLPLLMTLLWTFGTALGLLVLVMRSLLVQATTLRSEMEAVN